MALNAPRYAALEALRGDMDWSTSKATLRYKIRLERMDEERIARMEVEANGGRDA